MTQQTAQMTNETSAHKAPLNIVNVMLWLLSHLQKYVTPRNPKKSKCMYLKTLLKRPQREPNRSILMLYEIRKPLLE